MNIKHKLIILLLAGLPLSCEEGLDIDPKQSIGSNVALSTSENVVSVLMSAYAELGGQYNSYNGATEGGEIYGGDFNIASELLGANGEVAWAGTFTAYDDIWQKEMVASNGLAANNWIRAYRMISIANSVIDAIEVVDEEIRDEILAEARCLRGIVYFELVRLFALPYESGETNDQPGLPLILEPMDITGDLDVSRSTVEEVYEVIIDDLTEAESLLPEENGVRMTTFVASAYLSRVYLQQGKYNAAAQKADRVIQEGEFELLSLYDDNFNNDANTTEDIFAIQQNSQFNAGTANAGLATFYADMPGSIGRGDMEVTQDHLDIYEEDDERLELFYTGVVKENIQTGKWKDTDTNIPVIRLSEMYLTRAEANFREGTSVGDEPINDINEIRNRAGLADLDAGDLTLDEILLERRRELAFEGLRIHDLKRTRQNVTIGVETLPYDHPRLVFPIPEREIETNPDLQQNDAYL